MVCTQVRFLLVGRVGSMGWDRQMARIFLKILRIFSDWENAFLHRRSLQRFLFDNLPPSRSLLQLLIVETVPKSLAVLWKILLLLKLDHFINIRKNIAIAKTVYLFGAVPIKKILLPHVAKSYTISTLLKECSHLYLALWYNCYN